MEEYVKEDLAELDKALEISHSQKTHPFERLICFVEFFIKTMEGIKEPPPGCLYASYGYENIHFSDDIKQLIARSILKWRQAIEKLLDEVSAKKTANMEFDKISLADMFVVLFEGSFVVSRALNEPDLTAKQLKNYRDYLKLLFT